MIGVAQQDNGMVTGTHGKNNFWVIKVDSLGDLQWAKV